MVSSKIEGHIANRLVLIHGQLVPEHGDIIQYRLGKYKLPPVPDNDNSIEIETLKQATTTYRKNGKKYTYAKMFNKPSEVLEKALMRPCIGHFCMGLKKTLSTRKSRLCPKCSRYAEIIDQYSSCYNEKEVG